MQAGQKVSSRPDRGGLASALLFPPTCPSPSAIILVRSNQASRVLSSPPPPSFLPFCCILPPQRLSEGPPRGGRPLCPRPPLFGLLVAGRRVEARCRFSCVCVFVLVSAASSAFGVAGSPFLRLLFCLSLPCWLWPCVFTLYICIFLSNLVSCALDSLNL